MIQYRAMLEAHFGRFAIAAAEADAREQFPRESCGFITADGYIACANKAKTPEQHFEIRDRRLTAALKRDAVLAIVHSHPNGPIFPSEHDMRQQLAMDVPWVIVSLNEDTTNAIVAWGDALPRVPLIGRPFLHGIFDCYSTVRDVFRAGREELLKEKIDWPFEPIELPECARADEWWKTDDDLYMTNFAKHGFRQITRAEVRAGDVFLMRLGDSRGNPKNKINHAGVLLGREQILHHLPRRLSARVPAGLWANAADMWIRYGDGE